MPPGLSAEQIRDVNVRYHDAAAESYDSKWGIDYGRLGQSQVLLKLRKALGFEPRALGRSLEIGAGTGYFTLNMLQAGVVREAVATDISPGMLGALQASAARLGVEVETVRAEADSLPFPDARFDLVVGHAVLHHLPDLETAFAEFARVLRPGGRLVFLGEPSRYGDRVARLPKQAALRAAPLWRRVLGVGRPRADEVACDEDHGLEAFVDVHAFTPGQLVQLARGAGFRRARVTGEELLANWFGWANRTLESTADAQQIPMLWRRYAYHGYLALQQVDGRLLEGRLPPAIFYNLLLAAEKPAPPS